MNIDGFVCLKNYVIFVLGALLHWCIPVYASPVHLDFSGGLCLQLNKALHFVSVLNHLSGYGEVNWTLYAHKFRYFLENLATLVLI